jgi:quinol monooxygenase YgiN
MLKMVEMDENVTFPSQLAQNVEPVILINKFNVDPADVDGFLKCYAETATLARTQPGFISAQLHRGIGGSNVFLNYAIWASVGHFRRAFEQPEFRASLARYPANMVGSPHLFKKVAVPGICVD